MRQAGQWVVNRCLSPVAIPLLKMYTRLTGQERSRVLLVNEHDEVLLVRNIIGSKWSLPGGGIEKNETAIEAAIREVYEETGIRLSPAHLHKLAVIMTGESRAGYTAHVFQATISKSALPAKQHNRIEIIDTKWVPRTSVSVPVSYLTTIALAHLSK